MLFRHIIRALKSLCFLFRVYALKRSDAPNAVLIIYNKFNLLYWLASDPGLKDRKVYEELKRQGYIVNVLINPKMREIRSQSPMALAWLNPHHFMFTKKRRDETYRSSLHRLVTEINRHFSRCIPSSSDIQFWENKIHMHQVMAETQIRHPKTQIIPSPLAHDWSDIKFPAIFKSDDGYSSNGLWLAHDAKCLEKILEERVQPLIVQEFLNITFDIRVICVRGVIVSFYWRINQPSESWRPTATQNGATVKFFDLPKSVADLAKSIYTKTGCLTYGADICFKNDDLDTAPYVLEFSPIYQPNPTPPGGLETTRYSLFKNKSLLVYDRAFERLVSNIASQIILEDRMQLRDL